MIPELSATKLMRFDLTTKAKEILGTLVEKHHLKPTSSLYRKGSGDVFDQLLDLEKDLGILLL